MPAMASEAPINFMNPRRETASAHSDAPLGNSRCIISRKSSLPASSSRLRQNSGPWVSAMRAARGLQVKLVVLAGANLFAFFFSSFAASFALPCFIRFLPSAYALGCNLPPLRGFTLNNLYRWHVEQLVMSISRAQVVLRDQIVPQRELVGIFLAVELHRSARRRLLDISC